MHSAILPAYTPIGIHGNHMSMTKFETADDPGFVSVAGELRRWVKKLESAPRVGDGNVLAPEGSGTAVERNEGGGTGNNSGGVTHHGNIYGAMNVVHGSQTFSGNEMVG